MTAEYMVFYMEQYYPSGGWKDFKKSFNTLGEAIEYIDTLDCILYWAHIVHKGKIILEFESDSEMRVDACWKFKSLEE